MGSTVSQVTLTLSNLSHSFPGDVDILLVGPTGQKVMVMSDAGEDPDLSNVTLTFSDAAASALPAAAQIVSGTFRPTDFEAGETLPAPAPAGPYARPACRLSTDYRPMAHGPSMFPMTVQGIAAPSLEAGACKSPRVPDLFPADPQ